MGKVFNNTTKNKAIFLIFFVFIATMIASCFSFSFVKVHAEEACCSESSPHLVTELGSNNAGAESTSFNYYAMQGLFAETGHYFKQTADFIFDDGNELYVSELNSHYDGQSFKISCGGNAGQIFSLIGESGSVSNLKVYGKITGSQNTTAGVCLELQGTLENVSLDGEIRTTSSTTKVVGGLVGKNIGGTIINCYNLADIYQNANVSSLSVGGLVGENTSGEIYSSFNWGNILVLNSQSSAVGGIVGYQNGNSIIRNCYNSGKVSSENGTSYAGGLIGNRVASDKLSLIQCYNVGSIIGSTKGGLIGRVANASIDTYNFNFFKADSNLYSCGSYNGLTGSDSVGDSKTEEAMANNSLYKGWLFGFDYSDFSGWTWSRNPLRIEIDGILLSKKLPRLAYEEKEALTPFVVSFDKNSEEAIGTMLDQVMFAEIETAIKPAEFYRVGYKIVGWSTIKGATLLEKEYEPEEKIKVSQNITLYAVWNYEQTYTLRFNADGGDCDTSQMTVHTGLKIGALPVPTKFGYKFLGWIISEIGEGYITTETIYTLEKDSEAVAIWEENVYIINYLDQPATAGGNYVILKTVKLRYSEVSYHPEEADLGLSERENLVPIGLSLNRNGESELVEFGSEFVGLTEVDYEQIDFYVIYKNSKYVLTLNTGLGEFESSGSKSMAIDVWCRKPISNLATVPDPIRTGYQFANWTLTKPDGSTMVIDETYIWSDFENLSAEAKWTPNSYSVEFYNSAKFGSGLIHREEVCVYDGSPCLYPLPKADGHTFLGWSTMAEDASGILPNSANGEEYVNIYTETGTLRLYAIWKEHSYTISYKINNSKLSNNDFTAGPYLYSQAVNVLNNSNFPGVSSNGQFVLDSFNTTASGTGISYSLGQSLQNSINEKDGFVLELYAIWETTYLIKVEPHSSSVSGGGKAYFIQSGNATELTERYIIKNTEITLTAVVYTGYRFVGWYNSSNTKISTSLTYKVTVTAANTYKALWEVGLCDCNNCENPRYLTYNYCVNCYSGSSNWCSICNSCTQAGHNNSINHGYANIRIYMRNQGSTYNPSINLYVNGVLQSLVGNDGVQAHYGATIKMVASDSGGNFSGWYSDASRYNRITTSKTANLTLGSSDLYGYAFWIQYDCSCEPYSSCDEIIYYDDSDGLCDNCSDNTCSCCGECYNHCPCYDFCTNCGGCGSPNCYWYCPSVQCWCCNTWSRSCFVDYCCPTRCDYCDKCTNCHSVCTICGNCTNNCCCVQCWCCDNWYPNYSVCCEDECSGGCGYCTDHCHCCTTCGGSGICPGTPAWVDTTTGSCDQCGAAINLEIWACPVCPITGYGYDCGSCGYGFSTENHQYNPPCPTCGGSGIASINMGSSIKTEISSKPSIADYEICESCLDFRKFKYEAILNEDEDKNKRQD